MRNLTLEKPNDSCRSLLIELPMICQKCNAPNIYFININDMTQLFYFTNLISSYQSDSVVKFIDLYKLMIKFINLIVNLLHL
jgi:hypothetical protein